MPKRPISEYDKAKAKVEKDKRNAQRRKRYALNREKATGSQEALPKGPPKGTGGRPLHSGAFPERLDPLRAPKGTKAALDALAKEGGISVSQVRRDALRCYLVTGGRPFARV